MGSLCSSDKDPPKEEKSRKKTKKKAALSKKQSSLHPKALSKQLSQQSLPTDSPIVAAAPITGAQRGSVVAAPKVQSTPAPSAAIFTDSDAERVGNPLVGSGDRRGSLADSSTSLRMRLLKLEDTARAQAAKTASVPHEKRNRAKEERLHAWLEGAAARTAGLLDPQDAKGFLKQQAAKAEALEKAEARRATISSGSSLAADSDYEPKPSQQGRYE